MKLFEEKLEPPVLFVRHWRHWRDSHCHCGCLVPISDHPELEGWAGHRPELHCTAIKGITGAQSLATVPTVIIIVDIM